MATKVKEALIEAIKAKVKETSRTVSFDSTELFEAIPVDVDHGSELLDNEFELIVNKKGVTYRTVSSYAYCGKDEEESTEERFSFTKLNLVQLAFILYRL